MICCYCGKEIGEDLHFCPYCGGKDPLEIYADDITLANTNSKVETTSGEFEVLVNESSDENNEDSINNDSNIIIESEADVALGELDANNKICDSYDSGDIQVCETVPETEQNPEQEEHSGRSEDEKEKLEKDSTVASGAKKRKKEKKVKETTPRKKSKVGVVILAVFILALLGTGGYFAYITWFSPEARFAYAMEQGLAAETANEFEKAAENYGRAIDIDLTSAEAYISRGDMYLKLGDHSKAVDDYLKAYFISADDPELCIKLGDSYFAQGIYDNAENYYREAIELSGGKDAYAYSKLGDTYFASGDRDAALEVLSEGITATSDEDIAEQYEILLNSKYTDLVSAADSFAQSDNYEGAIESYSLAVQTNPELPAAYAGRAECEYILQNYADACADYALAISYGDISEENYLSYANAGIALAETSPECLSDVVAMLESGYDVTGSDEILSMLIKAEPSVPAGNYDKTFALELTSLCDIHYTLDGSEPDESSPVYNEPIEIGTGDTELKYIVISENGISGEQVSLNYNVTTIEMKAMASFEKYFNDHFNDNDQDIFVYDVTGDGLKDMIIVDKNPDDDKLYRVRLYIFDGSATTPVFLNSKATQDNFALCIYNGEYCFLSIVSDSETVDRVQKTTDTYSIFRISETGESQELKKYTIKTEGNAVISSDLKEDSFVKIKIIGVPSLLIDAMGKFEVPEAELAYGSRNIVFYNNTYYTNCEGFDGTLDNLKQLDVECGMFTIADNTIFYYAEDETSANSLYKMSLDGSGDSMRIGEGNGETLIYAGGWIYVGNDIRYSAETGEKKIDTYVNIEKVVLTDGSYVFYQAKLSDALSRSDKDQFNSVDILAKYDAEFEYFTDGGYLYQLRTDKMPQLIAYTLNGTYVYDVAIDSADLTGCYMVSDGILYLMQNNGVASISLADGKLIKEYVSNEFIAKNDIPVCTGNGKLVIADSDKEGIYIILDLDTSTAVQVEISAEVKPDNTQP